MFERLKLAHNENDKVDDEVEEEENEFQEDLHEDEQEEYMSQIFKDDFHVLVNGQIKSYKEFTSMF